MKRFWPGVLWVLLFNVAVLVFLRPVYANPDGVGYFSYLWSIFSEGTLSFASVYQRYHLVMPLTRTSQGWLANNWAFGTVLLWLPFFEAGNAFRYFFGTSNPLTAREALCLANFGSMVFGGGCLSLLYTALSFRQETKNRLLIVILTLFGTPLFYYSFIDTSYAHAATAFASGLFIWYWLRSADEKEVAPLRWGTLGLLAGIAACVRTQEVLVVIAPAWEWLRRYRREPSQRSLLWSSAAAMAGGFLIGFSPQALVWKLLYGSFFAAPSAFNLAASNFALGPTLFSSYHGLIAWTPLFVIALAGLVWDGIAGDETSWALFAIIAGQVLINCFSVAWWGGLAFGLRQLTGASLIAGLGVASFLKHSSEAKAVWRKAGIAAACLCSAWTALLALRSYSGTLDLLYYVSPRELAAVATGLNLFLQSLSAIPKNSTSVPMELFGILVIAELGAGFWMRRVIVSPRWLLLTTLALILFADVKILQAGRSPRPDFAPGTYLEASQLGDFFKYESYAVKALYHAKRGEKETSQAYFNLADTTLPVSPATEAWRQQLKQWRTESN